jgi:DNA-binding LacI/PurR family transcriptional regulator
VELRIEKLVGSTVWADTNHWHEQGCVRRDEKLAGARAAQALLEGGSRRIVWVGPDHVPHNEGDHYSFALRREGAREVVDAAGAEWIETLQPPNWTDQTHRELRPFLSASDPARRAGLLTYDGIYRGPLVMTAAMIERRVPGVDFALAACDDSPLTTDLLPMLTRVEFDRTALGRRAAEMIVRRIEHPEEPCPSELHRDCFVAGSTATLRHSDRA